MLDPPQYLLGSGALLLCVGSLALAATRVRGRLLFGWSGLPARLADVVLTLALLIWTCELLGAFGLLGRLPLLLACLATGAAIRLAVAAPGKRSADPPPEPSPGAWGARLGAAIAAVVIAHWMIGTVDALRFGITSYDSTWYHMPFAAHFAQTGSTLDFAFVSPRYLSWFYPQNSELLHGAGIVLLRRDLLSPLLNLLWLGGCLAAAWSVGRPYGKGHWTLVAAAVLLDSGVMADQAGQARNDTLGVFFLLVALAILVTAAAADRECGPRLGPLAVAGLSIGLAAGTKLTFLAPAAAMLIGIPTIVAVGRRWRALRAFAAPLIGGCGFWYLRNIAFAGNPLPWIRSVGPLRLDGPDQGLGGRPQHSVLDYFGNGDVWRRWLEPDLSHRLGELWPVLLALAALAAFVCLLRGSPTLRLAGFAAVAALLAYLLDGTSAEGPAGIPQGFASSLRHLLPALFLCLVLAPLVLGRAGRAGWALAGALAALLVASDLSATTWRPGFAIAAAVAVVAILCLPTVRGRLHLPVLSIPGRRVGLRPITTILLTAAIATPLVGGWFIQRDYLSDRYAGQAFRSAGLSAAFDWAAGQRQQRIATTVPIQYPLMGTDLSNRVDFLGRHGADAAFHHFRGCRAWRAALAAGRYRYVVTAGGRLPSDRGSSRCLVSHPGARLVIHAKKIFVFRLHAQRSSRS